MVIIKAVKLVSNRHSKNVVVEYLETIPTKDNPTVLQAQRVSNLSFEAAKLEIGKQLHGIIIKAKCNWYQYLPKGREDEHDWSSSESRYVYVEEGDDISDLLGPILPEEEMGANSDTNWGF